MYHNGNMQFPKRKPQYAKEETKLNLIVIKEKAVKSGAGDDSVVIESFDVFTENMNSAT